MTATAAAADSLIGGRASPRARASGAVLDGARAAGDLLALRPRRPAARDRAADRPRPARAQRSTRSPRSPHVRGGPLAGLSATLCSRTSTSGGSWRRAARLDDPAARARTATPEETGDTYYENARGKARYGRGLAPADAWMLGEDSGIEVDALGWGARNPLGPLVGPARSRSCSQLDRRRPGALPLRAGRDRAGRPGGARRRDARRHDRAAAPGAPRASATTRSSSRTARRGRSPSSETSGSSATRTALAPPPCGGTRSLSVAAFAGIGASRVPDAS